MSSTHHQQHSDRQNGHWSLRLYVAGSSGRSLTAQENLKRICDEHLKGRYFLEVVDIHQTPHLAEKDRIFATPTVVRKSPDPQRKIIGDLTNEEQVLAGLGLLH